MWNRSPSSVSVTLGFPVRGSPLLRHTVSREISNRTPPRQDFDCSSPLGHLLFWVCLVRWVPTHPVGQTTQIRPAAT